MFDDTDRKSAPKESSEEISTSSSESEIPEPTVNETKPTKAESAKTDPKNESLSSNPMDSSETDQVVSLLHTMELITQRVNSSMEKITQKLDELSELLLIIAKRIDEQNLTKDPIQQRLSNISNTVLSKTMAIIEQQNLLPPEGDDPPAENIEEQQEPESNLPP